MKTRAITVWVGALVALGAVVTQPAHAAQQWAISATTGGQKHDTAAVAMGELGLRWHWRDWLGLCVAGRSGVVQPLHQEGVAHSHERELLLALLAGPCARLKLANWQLRGSVQLAHVHHAGQHTWEETPAANLAGDSAGSVTHRTGLEAAIGVSLPPVWKGDAWTLRLEVDGLWAALPSSPLVAGGFGGRIGLALVQ